MGQKEKVVDWQIFLDNGGFAYLKANGWSPEDAYPDGGAPRELYAKWLRGEETHLVDPELTIAGIPRSERLYEYFSYTKVPGYKNTSLENFPQFCRDLGINPEQIRDEVQREKYIKYLEELVDK